MKNKASFSSLPFEITHKIVINVLEDTKFDYLKHPNDRNFMELAKTDKKYLYIYRVMPLRLVSKSLKEIVDSIIFSVLEIQHETPVISYIHENDLVLDRLSISQISDGYPFGVAGLVMDQFNDSFGIMSPNEQSQVFSSYYQFKLGRDVFRHVTHLYIYSCPEFDTIERVALLSPPRKYLVPENFPKLRKVTLSLSNDRLSKNNTNALRKFFIYFRKSRNQQPIEVDLNMKDTLKMRFCSFFALVKILEISKLVVSLTISGCVFPPRELKNIAWFTNMKSFVLYDCGTDIEFFDVIISLQKKIEQFKALEKFEVYSQIFNFNSKSPLTILPPTITSLTLHYDILLAAIVNGLDTKSLCSGLTNVKYLHLYAVGAYISPEDRDVGLTALCRDDSTNFLFPSLESFKSTFLSISRSLYAVMFDKVITPNKHTIKKLDWDLGDDVMTMIFIDSDLSKIEEFSLHTTGDSKMILDEYHLFMNVIERMKSLKKLTFNTDEDSLWFEVWIKLAVDSLSSPSLLPQLQSIDGLFPFTIDFCSPNDFQSCLGNARARAGSRFLLLIDRYGQKLALRPFDVLTVVAEEGPFYPLGTDKGIYARGHFFLDMDKSRELLSNASIQK